MLIATRGSLLARTQSQAALDEIARAGGPTGELVVIRSEGDDLTVPLHAPSRPGAFVATLRDALLAGRVDVAVHSTKDLPSQPLPGVVLAAHPRRGNPADVVVGTPLDQLPAGGRVGTSSPRRASWLQHTHPDLLVVPIRGNVDTRIGKIAEGIVDAVILAAAGLERLGRLGEATQMIDPTDLIPAPGQGALAIECRSDSPFRADIVRIDDPMTRLCVTAERAVLQGLQATCTTPVGAFATWAEGALTLVADLDGVRAQRSVPCGSVDDIATAEAVGLAVARALR